VRKGRKVSLFPAFYDTSCGSMEKKYGCVLDEKIVYKDRSGEERNNIREEIGMVH
jgi:hypothetical protein